MAGKTLRRRERVGGTFASPDGAALVGMGPSPASKKSNEPFGALSGSYAPSYETLRSELKPRKWYLYSRMLANAATFGGVPAIKAAHQKRNAELGRKHAVVRVEEKVINRPGIYSIGAHDRHFTGLNVRHDLAKRDLPVLGASLLLSVGTVYGLANVNLSTGNTPENNEQPQTKEQVMEQGIPEVQFLPEASSGPAQSETTAPAPEEPTNVVFTSGSISCASTVTVTFAEEDRQIPLLAMQRTTNEPFANVMPSDRAEQLWQDIKVSLNGGKVDSVVGRSFNAPAQCDGL